MKTCTKCGETRDLDLFPTNKRVKDGRASRCRECHNAQVRANKNARRVWHECSWCGAERFIDRRDAAKDPLCSNDQRLNVLARVRAKQYLEGLPPNRKMFDRGLSATRESLREIANHDRVSYLTVANALAYATNLYKPGRFRESVIRTCPNCKSDFSTDVPRQVHCSDRCAIRAARGRQRLLYGRFWVSDARRLALYERDGWLCFCGDLVIPWGSTDAVIDDRWATLDHIQPRSLGGSDEESNLRTAHFGCNAERGADPDWELEFSAA